MLNSMARTQNEPKFQIPNLKNYFMIAKNAEIINYAHI